MIGKYRRRARANLMMALGYRGEGGVCKKKKRSKAGASARAQRPFLSSLCVRNSHISHINNSSAREREQTELPPRAMSSAASSLVQGPSAPRATPAYCVSK